MTNHIKKYYTFSDEFQMEVGQDFCINTILKIIKTYKKEPLFRAFSSIAMKIGVANDYYKILDLQKEMLNIPTLKKSVIIHRQATCIIFQFLLSIPDQEFGYTEEIRLNDIFLLFILANQISDLKESEHLAVMASSGKKMFFTNIKSIHFTNTKDDLQAGFFLFKKYYKRIVELNKYEFSTVISDYIVILETIEDRKYTEIFNLFDKYAVLNFEDSNKAWWAREPKFGIPNEFPFLQKYPLIKIKNEYLVTDVHSIFSSLIKNLYQVLIEYDNILFKGEFGKKVVEKTIIELIVETFVDDKVKELKVGSKKYEYGDFGLLYENYIFLFEIKTSLLNNNTIYTNRYDIFMKIFNDKFIKAEGVHQQVQKIKHIESHFEHFCSLSKIDPKKKYTIYPVLVSFDESLMSFHCNWYISTRFDIFKRICKLKLEKFELAPCHSTVTFNEIYRMRYVERAPSERLMLLKNYSDDRKKMPISFSFFLQDLNAFKLSKEGN